MTNHPYLGMWVTEDGRIRQELLPNGRYDEARGTRRSAYQGRYEIRGTRIDYSVTIDQRIPLVEKGAAAAVARGLLTALVRAAKK